MYPIAIAQVGTRIGPYLGRLAARDAALVPGLIAKLRVGGGFVGSKISDVVEYVKSSPVNAMMVLTTLASLGYSASELLSGLDKGPEVREFAAQLDETAMAAAGLIDKAGAESEKVDVVPDKKDDKTNAEAAIQILSWARSHYGTIEKAVEAHRMNQAFFEMSLDDVKHGFNIYRLR